MSFGWSVSDIISACTLIKDVIKSLDSTNGARSNYQAFIRELWSLERSLMQVHEFCQVEDGHGEQRAALLMCTRYCKDAIDRFLTLVRKLQPYLANGTKRNSLGFAIRGTFAKIDWALCKEAEITAFRDELGGHTRALHVLFDAIQAQIVRTESKRNERHFDSLFSQLHSFYFRTMASVGSIAKKTTQSLRTSERVLGCVQLVISNHIKLFRTVLQIQLLLQTRLPAQIERQQPVILFDALGFRCPFHLEFVRSANALKAVLKANLNGISGSSELIDEDEFAIEDSVTKSDIDLYREWFAVFKPGQVVYMSMLYRPDRCSFATCPGCGHQSNSLASDEIVCSTCGMAYRRVQVIEDEMTDSNEGDQHIPVNSNAETLEEADPIEKQDEAEPAPIGPRKRKRQESFSPYRRVRILDRHLGALTDNSIHEPVRPKVPKLDLDMAIVSNGLTRPKLDVEDNLMIDMQSQHNYLPIYIHPGEDLPSFVPSPHPSSTPPPAQIDPAHLSNAPVDFWSNLSP